MNELSKYLCLLLRHQPEKAELDMDEHGWVSVEQLIDGVNRHSSYKLDRELLEQIVAEDNKGRYRFDESHEKIKCCQGHSVPWVEPELEYCEPPEFLYHGTTTKATPVVLKIAASEMNKDGYRFGVTENEVWCTEEVPVKYICDRVYII